MPHTLLLLLSAGCLNRFAADPGADPAGPGSVRASPAHLQPAAAASSSAAPPDACAPDPRLEVFAAEVDEGTLGAHVADVRVELSAAADVALTCVAVDDPAEVHLTEARAWRAATLSLRGLRADTDYDCRVTPVCPQARDGSTELSLRTAPLPEGLPSTRVEHDPDEPLAGGDYTLFNHQRLGSATREQQLVVVDPEGRIRWHYALPAGLDAGVEVLPAADGTFAWGGGNSPLGAPAVVDVDGATLERVEYPGSAEATFHHDGKRLVDGRFLTLEAVPNSDRGRTWTGFALGRWDPLTGGLDWSWSSQQAVDAGRLDPGTGSNPWHANWADLLVIDGRETALVGLCNISQVVAVDVASGEVAWVWGPGGDFALYDVEDQPLGDGEWPQCLHGPDYRDGRLVLFDNGRERARSRVSRYRIDPDHRRTVLEWTWSDGRFADHLGDADDLPEGRVLVTESVTSGPADSRGTRILEVDADGATLWALELDAEDSAVYRAQRILGCGPFTDTRYCPDLAERLAALAPRLAE